MQPLTIAPYKTGLVTSISPWLLPPDGFQELINAHVRNGRIEKRLGYRLIGYNAHHPTTFTANGDSISAITKASPAAVTTSAAHNFSTGNQVVIIGSGMPEVQNQRFTITVTGATTFTLDGIDSTTYTTYTSGSKVYLSPSVRIMGLTTYTTSTNQEVMVGWDTKKMWLWDYTPEGFTPLDDHATAPTNYLDGGEFDYISYVQWANYNAGNIMYFTNGLVQSGSTVNGLMTYNPAASPVIARIAPVITSTNEVYGCKGVCVFRQRLLLFATHEGANAGATTFYPQRVRWCRVQDPRISGDQWREDIRGNGGFADASTQDQYISHQALKDNVIVYFTNSIWMLSYQADPIEPFRWKKLVDFVSNKALGAGVGYDQYAIHIGNKGIYATDGNKSERIDDQIEEYIATEVSKSYFKKVYGHRDYVNNCAIFLYPEGAATECNAALVRDDQTGAFSTFNISLNVLGDGASPNGSDLTMEDFPDSEAANPWSLPLTALDAEELTWFDLIMDPSEETLIGGTITGQVMQLNFGYDDDESPINFEATTGNLNPFRDQGMEAHLGYIDLMCDSDQNTELQVAIYRDNTLVTSDVPYMTKTINLLPNLGEVAEINGITIKSPATDGVIVTAGGHGLNDGDTIYIYKVEGMVNINDTQFTVTNATLNTFDIEVDATDFETYTGGGIICLKEYYQNIVNKRIYVGCTSPSHTIKLGVTGQGNDGFKLHAMTPYFKPVKGRLL